MRTLITGGVKSGKSALAVRLAETEFPVGNRYFLATAEAFDDEMREKIRRHRVDRGDRFITVEEPLRIDSELRDATVLDCITIWLSNLFYRDLSEDGFDMLDRVIRNLPHDIIIVTNETGMGEHPMSQLSRTYHTMLGLMNQRIAAAVDRVVLTICGIPLIVKGPPLPDFGEKISREETK